MNLHLSVCVCVCAHACTKIEKGQLPHDMEWERCSASFLIRLAAKYSDLSCLPPHTWLCCFCLVAQSCPTLYNPWTATRQASLSFTISQSLHRLMSIESMMPSNHLIFCRHFLLLPSIFLSSGSFPVNQLFALGGQNIGASASVLPMNILGWFHLGLIGLISFLSKGLSSLLYHHSLKASILWHSAFFMVRFSHLYMTTGKTIALTIVPLSAKWYFP